MSFDFERQYSNEWKSLGFYYYFDSNKGCWQILGSKNGLLNFCNLLSNYVNSPLHTEISEHEHYGPDTYLKITTWYFSIIKKDGIYGSLEDIQKLAHLIKDKLTQANIYDEIVIDQEYSEKNECFIILKIMTNDFDPSKVNRSS